jgi:hypothetical protein
MNPISPLITQLENPADLNLDELLESLRAAATAYDDLRVRALTVEQELQRELKALIELIGPISHCGDPQDALELQADELCTVRRAARRRYNELFRNSPVRR